MATAAVEENFRSLRLFSVLICGVIFLSPLLRSSEALWIGDCNKALGMESGAIPDEVITASSIHDNVVGPQNARIRVDNKGGAWCPKEQIKADSREYLEVDLGEIHVVTATGTQGRYASGSGQEYTEKYQLEFWRPGLPGFISYIGSDGNKTLPGNSNTYLEVKNELSPPLIASKVRFVPISDHPRTICLRVELYGCNYTSGLLNYTASIDKSADQTKPQNRLATKAEVHDDSNEVTRWHGLGMLYDGKEGDATIFRTNDSRDLFRKGWDWTGWSHEMVENGTLKIFFTFDTMRNFSEFVFYTFSDPKEDFVLPTQAEIFFGDDGKDEITYHKEPLRTTFKSSLNQPLSREGFNVSVSLQSRPGKVLMVIFYFPKGWFLLSEVYFESEPCTCNLSDWWQNEASAPAERTADREDPHDVSTISAVNGHTRAYMGVVIGFVVGAFLLVATGLLVYVRRLRKRKSSPHVLKSHLSDSTSVAFDMRSLRLATSYSGGAGASMYGGVSGPEEDEGGSLYHEPYKTPLFSASEYSVATIGRQFSEYADGGVAAAKARKAQSQGEYAVPILSTPPPPPFNTTTNTPFATKNNTPYSTNANTPFNTTPISAPSTPFSQPPPPGSTPHSASTQFSTSSGQNSSASTLTHNGVFPSLIRLCNAPPPPVPPPPEKYLATPNISKDLHMQSPFGTALYQLKGGALLRNRSPRELPRQAVHLAEKLGEGEFGTVYVGEVVNPNEPVETSAGSTLLTQSGRKVVVGTLRSDAPTEKRDEAWQQAQLLANLQDPNIELLLGVVSRDDPLLLVLEFPTLGDLNQYLRRHVPDTTTPRLNHMRAISHGALIYMATQIASGMKYLENHNIIHADLATRNVLVAPGQLVKVGTIGSCRSLYAGDYFRYPSGDSNPTRIPLRWMSWEALFMGKFSTACDVWAFGVTLWEILTLGRQQPFERLSDDGVIENLAHCLHDDNDYIHLSQPATCPKEIYDLMQECWRKEADERPNFREIHLFLQRKNHGYAPDL